MIDQVVFREVGLFFAQCKLFNMRFSIVIWSSRIPGSNLRLPGYTDAIRPNTNVNRFTRLRVLQN